jgi:hypothetical protein
MGPPRAARSDHHSNFEARQLARFGVAAIVLLVFAWLRLLGAALSKSLPGSPAFTPNCRHSARRARCPLLALSGHRPCFVLLQRCRHPAQAEGSLKSDLASLQLQNHSVRFRSVAAFAPPATATPAETAE